MPSWGRGRRAALTALLVSLHAACAAPPPGAHPDPRHPDRLQPALDDLEKQLENPSAASVAALDDILKVHDVHHRSLVLRARLLLALRRPREALRDLERIDALYPPEPDLDALRGRALLETGRKREARAAFRRALDADPRHRPALLGLGWLLADVGAFEDAARYFGRAHEIDPSDEEARALFAAARALKTSPDAARTLAAPLEREKAGRLLVEAGQEKLGTEILLTLLKERPDDPGLLKAAATGLLRQGHLRQAEALLAKAVALRPRDAEAAYALGVAVARQPSPALQPRAGRLFEQAAALAPGDVRPHLAAAELHARSGGMVDAVRCFQAAQAADPAAPEPAIDYGRFLARQGNLGGAIASYRRGLEKNPDHALLQANLMAALYELGRANEAGRLQAALAARSDLDLAAKSVLDAYAGARK